MLIAPGLYLSDERLDYFGELFLANPALRATGVTFEAFLIVPSPFILPLPDVDYYPLLPAQRAVRDRLDAAAARMERALGVSEAQLTPASPAIRDGALVEKLRHHVWPRHAVRRQEQQLAEDAAS